MDVLLSVYHDRKALLYDVGVAAIAVNLGLRQGWIPIPEQLSSLDTPALLSTALITIVAICMATRLFSGRKYDSTSKSEVAVLPYWIPGLGHLPQLIFRGEAFLKSARKTSTQDGFALNLAGIKHTIIDNPALVDTISEKEASAVDGDELATSLRRNVFGFPDEKKNSTVQKPAALSNDFYDGIFAQPQMEDLLKRTIRKFKENVPNLVSFLDSLVDQAPWERVSDTTAIELAGGRQLAETNLLSLMTGLLGQCINSAYAGRAFVDDYPELHTDLGVIGKSFSMMATGLPRWVPLPRLPAGYIARKRLLGRLEKLQSDYDADDISLLFEASHDTLPGSEAKAVKSRAAVDLSLIWALNDSTRNLAFWLLVHVLSRPQLVDRIREEISPYARAVQPSNDFGLPEPPRLDLDVDGLEAKCPLFASCYAETVRLYDTAWSVKKVKEAFTVTDAQSSTEHSFRKGEYIDVSRRLRQTWSRFVSDAGEFKPDRFVMLDEAGKGPRTDWDGASNCAGMWSMGKNMLFAQKTCLAFVASVLVMWEVEPVERAGWRVPGHRQGASVAIPTRDIRVRLSRRKLE